MITSPQRRLNILIYLCLFAVVAAVYSPVRHFEFINYDDPDYVYQNPQVQSGLTVRSLVWAFTTNHMANWHPLTWLSHMLDWQLWGDNAGAHHLVNVLFHIAGVLLLFNVLNRMTAAPWRSAFVAALFGLHPLHVESVAWVAERKDVLSAFFWMLTLWAYVRYVEEFKVHGSGFTVQGSKADPPVTGHRSPVTVFYCLSLLFFTFGLMAKPMVVTLPFVLLLLDYWPLGRTKWTKPAVGERTETSLGRLVMEKLPFIVLAAASCVVTVWAQRSGQSITSLEALAFGDRLANAVVAYMRYIGKMFWPTSLAVFYSYQAWPLKMVLWAGAALLGVSGLAFWRARRAPYLAMGWYWYVGTLVPVIGLTQVGSQSMADRYTYIPLVGLLIMVAWSVPRGVVERRLPRLVTAAVAVAVVGFCAVLCRFQLRYWKNTETLFRHALEVTGPNWMLHNNLALALLQAGKPQEAIWHFEQALRIEPSYAESHYNLGLALAGRGRLPEAIEQWKQAVQIKPEYAEAHFNLGLAFQQTGQPQEAVGHFEQVVRIKPDSAEAYYNLGNALVLAGKPEDSIRYYQDALRLKPDYAEVHYNMEVVLLRAGKTKDAIWHYEQVLRIKPDSIDVENKLAWLLATLAPAEGGDPVRAVTLAEQACELTSNRVPAYLDTLAAAYASAGRFNDAIATAEKAIEQARSAGQPQLVSEIEARLELYRGGRAYRRPSM